MAEPGNIDDRRRFKELWKELLFARLLLGIGESVVMAYCLPVAAVMLMMLLQPGSGRASEFWFSMFTASLVIIFSPVAALPTLAVKRGALPFALATAVTAIGGAITNVAACSCGLSECSMATAVFAVIFGAIGLIEGVFEESIATLAFGVMGGALAGFVGHALAPGEAGNSIGGTAIYFGTIAVVGNLGIGLSLALGRWIRDLPKRKSAQEPLR